MRAAVRERPSPIEQLGAEPVPAGLRHGRPRSLFTLWFGANVQFATLSVGALSTSVFGLDFVPAVLAIVVGTLLSSSLVGLFSTRGPLTGVLQLVQSRVPFGRLGNLPSAAFTVVNGVGWCVVDSLLGIFILRDLTGMGFGPALAVMAVAQMGVAVVGYRLIHSVERALTVLLVVVFAVMSVYGFGEVSAQAPTAPAHGSAAAFLLVVAVTAARVLGWSAYASDYSRYLPATTAPRRVFLAAGGGSAVAGVWVGSLGAALGTAGALDDPSAMVSGLLPHALGTLVLLSLLLSTLASTVIDLYSGAMAALVAGFTIPRWVSVLVVGGLGTALAWYAGHGDFAAQLNDFLLMTGYWLAPWAAVTIVAFWGRGRPALADPYDPAHRFGRGLPCVLLALAVEFPFMNQSLYTGPLAAAHPALGPLGLFVGFLVAGGAYAVPAASRTRTTRLPLASDPLRSDT
ncbi:cytosine permease [Streptomyces sp. VRA16 Mangrove soil]|uniref:purine-cytosine permease family protein n=1 Tax=Streptomyces sp. VRA16 Mangrove soil TaxID=2817434 RepID=UPI001A9DB31D|nr:cytosine permease [Streptomyces sp. VRA16 Mangrove soil]MBO1330172.1 cytosine permease [Streptomyces sp. VRA16 Mangrove soil]